MARGVTQLALTGFRSMGAVTSWGQNYMQHLRLDFKAGSAQNCTLSWNTSSVLEVSGTLKSQLPVAGGCPAQAMGGAHVHGKGWAHAQRWVPLHLLLRCPWSPQLLSASSRKDSRTRVTHLLPRSTWAPRPGLAQLHSGLAVLGCVWDDP